MIKDSEETKILHITWRWRMKIHNIIIGVEKPSEHFKKGLSRNNDSQKRFKNQNKKFKKISSNNYENIPKEYLDNLASDYRIYIWGHGYPGMI
jgi:hypothetical protein